MTLTPALDIESAHEVSARMPGETLWLTALRADDVDIDVPGVLAGERHPSAIG